MSTTSDYGTKLDMPLKHFLTAATVVTLMISQAAWPQRSDINVSGFRAGMTLDEVRHITGPGYRELLYPVQDPHLFFAVELKNGSGQDAFYFTFFDRKLVGLTHIVEFANGQQPMYDQTEKDLDAKFGQPHGLTNDNGVVEYRFLNGQPIPPKYAHTPEDSCGGIVNPLVDQAVEVKYKIPADFVLPRGNTSCWNMTVIRAQVWKSSTLAGAVSKMKLELVHEEPVHQFLVEEQQRKNGQLKQQQTDASKNHAPM